MPDLLTDPQTFNLKKEPQMKTDLEAMSRKDLKKLGKDVEKALSTLEKRERKAALEAAEKAAAEHGFSLSELAGMKKGKSKAKNPPKFRNPDDAEQTWSGRGRKPAWVNAAEAKGANLEDYAI